MRHTIHIPIYHTCVKVHMVYDLDRCYKRICDNHNSEYGKDSKLHCRACVVWFDSSQYYMLFDRAEITHGVISHEIDHVVRLIADNSRLTGDEDTAHLCELITDSIYKAISKAGVTIAL